MNILRHMRATSILISVVALCLSGCVANPNLVFVTKGGITAHGSIFGVFKKHEEINLIAINPRELSDDRRRDIWIGLSSTNQTTFSEITEKLITDIGVSATHCYSAASPGHYYVCGYSFRFREREFVAFSANRYGYPPKDITAFVKLGSRKNGSSLSLPCSVNDFEKVFGKADAITRGFGW